MNKQDKPLKVAIKTFGCQMNAYDSEVAAGLLAHQGFQILHEHDSLETAEEPREKKLASSDWRRLDADVVIMNTCSVREHAEDRVYSRLGMLARAKEKNPDMIIGLMGCMVEEHREKLFQRFPHLDLMVGTRNIRELPVLIDQVKNRRRQISQIKQDGISIEYTDQIKREGRYHAWLPIMTGCNKVCTFCVVPITRGSEVSMKARDVFREAGRLVQEGVQWITLLGQNVNSYRGEEDGGKPVSFPDLMEMLCQIDGLSRISFTTSHPHDATEELFQVIRKNPKISRRFHLPIQSGSDRILKRMKRLHTYGEYKQKIDRLRELVPDISITTDVIAGFSGETEDDHAQTVSALREIRFDSAYIYKYSVRAATPAAKLPDDVPLEIKQKRNQELLDVQRSIEKEKNEAWVGRTVQGFFEKASVRNPGCLSVRTDQDRKLIVPAGAGRIGVFGKFRITGVKHETFMGESIPS